MIALTGGAFNHGLIMVNASGELRQLLKGSDCRVISSGMRNRVNPTIYVYPDFSVVCGQPVTDERAVNLWNPRLAGEVTSPSSVVSDRGEKLRYYQSIASLQIYLVIDQHRAHVESHARQDGGWRMREFSGLEAIIPLPALGCDLPLAESYHGVSF